MKTALRRRRPQEEADMKTALRRLWPQEEADMKTALRRFNKICHPSQRPRWQVDKEAIGLSRVQQCSSSYNPPS